MLDKSLLDKNDTDSEDEDNDVSPSSHVQSPPPSTTTTSSSSSSTTTTTTTIRKLSRPIDQPSLQQPPVSLLPMHHATCSSSSSTSHGFSNQRNNYRSESSLSSSHHPEDDDMHTERNGDEEEDDEYDDDGHSSSASYHLSDHHHHHHHQQQQQQQSSSSTPLPTPPPPPTSLPPTSQQFFPNHPQFRHHLATHYEQATLPSPNSVSGSYSSITESNINQRIKFMVKNAKKSSIDKKKSQRIGGIKSRPIKYLKHPLDRSIASFFLLTLFFTLLALITGLPVVLTLTLLLALSMLLIKCLNCSCKGYPANMVQATPIETFWLNPNDFTNSSSTKSNSNPMVSGNNNENNDTVNPNPENEENSTNDHLNPCNCLIPNSISTCLLFVDSELNIDQLRDIFMARIVQKPEMARFRSILTYKGLTRTPIWSRLSYEEFSIEKQIINDRLISSKEELKMHLLTLMRTNLSPNLPLWQIRRCSATYLNQVILILRIHQSVIDGCGLAKLLVQYLADQPPPKTTTFIRTTQGTTASTSHFKPRFGGINFTINLIRAAIVGPLTFSLWVIWAFTRRKNNYLSKVAVVKKSPRSTAMVHNDSKKDKLVLSSSSSKNSCSNSKYLDEAIISNNSNGENIINNATRNTNAITTSSPPLNYNNNNNGSWTEQSNQHTSNHNTQQQQQQKHEPHNSPSKSIYWTTVELDKVVRVKQVTRSCLNDVILAAVTGSVRQNLVSKNITNPPDIGVSLPVDLRGINDPENDVVKVKYVILTLPLPTSIEGAIPRLWEIRHNMEELKTSADPSVMYGAHHYLHYLLPGRLYRWMLNVIHRNSSISLSNIQGPTQDVSICSHRLRKVLFWMSPPPAVSISFNAFSYENQLYVTVTSSSELLPCAKALAKGFKKQVNLLNHLLSKRRVPGEGRPRKRPTYVVETPYVQGPYLTSELTAKLNAIQLERYQMNELLDQCPMNREDIEFRLEELKDEFSELMKQLRRRKSMVEYGMHNIVINVEDNVDEDDDEDMDGELRPAMRRFSFNVASRRSSVASAISMPSSRFQVSPPHLSRRYVSSSPEPSSPSEPYIKEETV